jgi:hypothetical protein
VKIPAVRISIEGDNQSGKTTFAFTAPRPLVGFCFDMGFERAILGARWEQFKDFKIASIEYDSKVKASESLWKDNDITVFRLPQPIQLDSVEVKGSKELWNYCNERIALCSRDPFVRSVVVDTMTLARRVKADAFLQQLQEKSRADNKQMRERLQQIEYGTVNDAIRDIYTTFEGVGKNLVATHHLTDERREITETDPRTGATQVKQVLTGNRLLEGLSQTHNYVDVALMFEGSTSLQGNERRFNVDATFRKCGYVPELKGTSLKNPTWDSLMNWMELKLGGRLEFPRAGEAP